MNNWLVTLLCSTAVAVSWTAPEQAAAAAPAISAAPAAQSYADLLEPVPDALSLLRAEDARRAQEPAVAVPVQFHHHHHHHHHHHNQGYFSFGFNPYYYRPERCYWTWGAPVWNGYRWVYQRVRACD